jgi:lipid-binding SYLF domain-containing protein
MKKLVLIATSVLCLLLLAACTHHAATAATPQGTDAQKADLGRRVDMATTDLTQLVNTPESSIPDTILVKARCVAVIPDMVKGGFVFGGEHGRGLASCRRDNGWTAPVPIALTGGSWGAQIGVESADVVLVFLNDHGLPDLLSDKVKLGADAGIAAGPVGRHAEAATDVLAKSEILSYSRTKGLFAGLTLNGAKLSQDMDTTAALYGKQVPYTQILDGQVKAPAEAQKFVAALRHDFSRAVSASNQ